MGVRPVWRAEGSRVRLTPPGVSSFGFATSIGSRAFFPGQIVLAQGIDVGWTFPFEIDFFSNVSGKIEEVFFVLVAFVSGHEFQVAAAEPVPDGFSSWLPPVERAVLIGFLLSQVLDDVHALEGVISGLTTACQAGDGGGEIKGDRDLIGFPAGGYCARPVDDGRNTDASFVGASFGAGQGGVSGTGGAAIVPGKDDQGLFLQLMVRQGCQHAADGSIHVLDHGHIDIGRCRPLMPERGVQREGIFLKISRSLKGRVRTGVGQVEKEGFVLCLLDEIDRVVRH